MVIDAIDNRLPAIELQKWTRNEISEISEMEKCKDESQSYESRVSKTTEYSVQIN